ncbi:MAG: hypothetical protein WCC84_10150, partial [Candidatus Cybelea sp.]
TLPGGSSPSPGSQHWVSTNVPGYTQGVSFLFLYSLLPQSVALAATAPGMTGSVWWNQASVYTALLSHEMYESFTDPNDFTGWTDTNFPSSGTTSECCDICDDILNGSSVNVLKYGPWSIDCYWSNQDNECVLGYENNWSSLGRPQPGFISGVGVGQNQSGAWEIFTISPSGDLWACTGTTRQANGAWTGGVWNPLVTGPSLTGWQSPIVANDVTLGLLEVFAVNGSGQLWHVYQTAPNGPWMAGEVLGAPPSSTIASNIAIGQNAPNPSENGYQPLEAFAVGSDNQLHHIWQLGAWKGWSGWGDSLGAPLPGLSKYSGPTVGSNADGRLEVFVLGNDSNIWHIWQVAPNSGWSAWSSLPIGTGVTIRPLPGTWQCGRNNDGRLEIFVVGANQGDSWDVYHIWQTAPNGGWSDWQLLMPLNVPRAVGFQGFPTVVNNHTDPQELQVCTIGSDGGLWTINQGASSPSGWNPWRFLASPSNAPLYPLQAPVIAVTSSGLTVIISGDDGNLWSISQTSPGGTWGPLVASLPS